MKPIRKALSLWSAILLAGATFLFPGCATREEVAAIVAQSNAAVLTGQLGGLPRKGETAGPTWQEASERIETFIAAHPDQKILNDSLRIREAMLLLAAQQPGLARAAFNGADAASLNARDKALKQNADSLLWWFAHSHDDTWVDTDKRTAAKALADLKAALTEKGLSPDARDYLGEMRAWIGFALSKQQTGAGESQATLADAITVYATTFTPDDLAFLAVVAAGREPPPDPAALTPDVRRRLRGSYFFAQARALIAANPELKPHFADPHLNQILHPDTP